MKKTASFILASIAFSHSYAQSQFTDEPVRLHLMQGELNHFVMQASVCSVYFPDIRAKMLQSVSDVTTKQLGASKARLFLSDPDRKKGMDFVLSKKPGDEELRYFPKPDKEVCLTLMPDSPSAADVNTWRIKFESDILFADSMYKRCLQVFPGIALGWQPTNKDADELRFGLSPEGRKASAEFLRNPSTDSLELSNEQVRQHGYHSWEQVCRPLTKPAPRYTNTSSASRAIPAGQQACLFATYTPVTKEMAATGRSAIGSPAHLDFSLDAISTIQSVTGKIWGLDQLGKPMELLIDETHPWTIQGAQPFDPSRGFKQMTENGVGSINLIFGSSRTGSTQLFPGKQSLPSGAADLTLSETRRFLGRETRGKPSFVQVQDFAFKICGPSSGKESIWLAN